MLQVVQKLAQLDFNKSMNLQEITEITEMTDTFEKSVQKSRHTKINFCFNCMVILADIVEKAGENYNLDQTCFVLHDKIR